MTTIDELNQRSQGCLPAHLGLVVTRCDADGVHIQMAVTPPLMAPNGYLHAGAILTLADTCAGYGCMSRLPEGATGFTTLELKSNHLATALEGTVACVARPVHAGRTTQVWDATVTHLESGRTLALFRCTQLVLYPRG
ncbi:MAG: thioesterase [Leptothrix sp. (in: Bacteria)]|nr:thioesterase [Leptothrix sp. (in: b-proteobacteria)]